MNVALRPLDRGSVTVLSTCSGAGGLDLGIRIAEPRARTVCYVEREAYAAATLVARMADKALDCAPVWDDLQSFDGRPWRGLVDILAGGYPCQPESVAGKRRGAFDERWLWNAYVRLIGEIRPARCFFENVANHLRVSGRRVLEDLSGLGYRPAAGVFSAEECGASHRRERLFIMADACGNERGPGNEIQQTEAWQWWRESASGSDHMAYANGNRREWTRLHEGQGSQGGRATDTSRIGSELADTCSARRSGGQQPGSCHNDGNGSETHGSIAEFCGASGAGDGIPLMAPGPRDHRWPDIIEIDPSIEPSVCRMVDGMAARVDRLRLTGNGVFPLAAAIAYRTLDAALAAGRGAGRSDAVAVMESAE